MAECAEKATELPEIATELLDFGQIWTRVIAEIKEHDFSGCINGCAGAVF